MADIPIDLLDSEDDGYDDDVGNAGVGMAGKGAIDLTILSDGDEGGSPANELADEEDTEPPSLAPYEEFSPVGVEGPVLQQPPLQPFVPSTELPGGGGGVGMYATGTSPEGHQQINETTNMQQQEEIHGGNVAEDGNCDLESLAGRKRPRLDTLDNLGVPFSAQNDADADAGAGSAAAATPAAAAHMGTMLPPEVVQTLDALQYASAHGLKQSFISAYAKLVVAGIDMKAFEWRGKGPAAQAPASAAGAGALCMSPDESATLVETLRRAKNVFGSSFAVEADEHLNRVTQRRQQLEQAAAQQQQEAQLQRNAQETTQNRVREAVEKAKQYKRDQAARARQEGQNDGGGSSGSKPQVVPANISDLTLSDCKQWLVFCADKGHSADFIKIWLHCKSANFHTLLHETLVTCKHRFPARDWAFIESQAIDSPTSAQAPAPAPGINPRLDVEKCLRTLMIMARNANVPEFIKIRLHCLTTFHANAYRETLSSCKSYFTDVQWNEIEAKVQDHLLDNSAKGRHQGASHQGTGGGGKQSTQGGGAGGGAAPRWGGGGAGPTMGHFTSAGHTPRTDWAQQISDCEARYTNFKEHTPAMICYNDIPWPLTAHGRHVLFGFLSPTQMYDTTARKQAYKRLITRWHPDKFESTFGSRLLPADKTRILQQVKAVTQEINLANSQD